MKATSSTGCGVQSPLITTSIGGLEYPSSYQIYGLNFDGTPESMVD